jgi:formylglycine-generating enzyme required for sulfatase activity
MPGIPETVQIPAAVPFLLGRTPVTNAEYGSFLESGRAAPPPWWNRAGFDSPRQPVVGASWEDARLFTLWLSETTGDRWRLPTEWEWEFAACGGLVHPATAWGDAIPSGEIPEGPLASPWEAGRGTPNGYGLLDMGTIVHEWCLDWADTARVPPRRASRGGSWRHAVRWSSPSSRSSLPESCRYSDYGFRVLREVDAQ